MEQTIFFYAFVESKEERKGKEEREEAFIVCNLTNREVIYRANFSRNVLARQRDMETVLSSSHNRKWEPSTGDFF